MTWLIWTRRQEIRGVKTRLSLTNQRTRYPLPHKDSGTHKNSLILGFWLLRCGISCLPRERRFPSTSRKKKQPLLQRIVSSAVTEAASLWNSTSDTQRPPRRNTQLKEVWWGPCKARAPGEVSQWVENLTFLHSCRYFFFFVRNLGRHVDIWITTITLITTT